MIEPLQLYRSEKTETHWKIISVDNGRIKMIQMVESAVPVECSHGDFKKAIETGQMVLNEGLSCLVQFANNIKTKKK